MKKITTILALFFTVTVFAQVEFPPINYFSSFTRAYADSKKDTLFVNELYRMIMEGIDTVPTTWNKTKDQWVLSQISQKPISTSKMTGRDGITTYYEMQFSKLRVQMAYAHGIMCIISILNERGRVVGTNHPQDDKENKISPQTFEKIKQKALLIK